MTPQVCGRLRAWRDHRFVRFLAAGVVNTGFGYGVFVVGIMIGLVPEIALGIATVLGALFNYWTTARFVFGHRRLNLLPAFVAGYAVLYGVNAAAIRVLIALGAPAVLAQAGLTPVMAALSFVVFRYVVFRPVETE